MADTIVGVQARNVPQAALVAGKLVSVSPTILYGISGYNSGPAQFVQLHDKASAGVNAEVPVHNIAVAAAANFSIDFGVYGMSFANGLYVGNSSTAAALTAGAADCQFFARVR